MKDQFVVVLCNLKPRSLADFMSNGMVMCGETENKSKVELLRPPAGSSPGDLISFEGFERQPPQVLPVKKSPFETVAPKLKVNAEGVACFEEIPFRTQKGVVTSETIRNGVIH